MSAHKMPRRVVNYFLWILGTGSSILVFLIWFGFIPETVNGVKFVTDNLAIFGLLALVIFFICTLWLGYQIRAWHMSKMKAQATSVLASSSVALEQAPQSPRLVKMYASRFNVNLEKVLDSVNDKYWSLAVTQHKASLDVAEKLLSMIQSGKSIILLLANPDPNKDNPEGKEPEFIKWCEKKITALGVCSEIEGSLKRLHDHIFIKLKTKEERARFDVRLYNLPPLQTMIIIDKNAPDARLQFEPFGFKPDPAHSPLFIIEKAKDPDVFDFLLKSFEYVYGQSKPVKWKNYESSDR
jgi:hypothetical protein